MKILIDSREPPTVVNKIKKHFPDTEIEVRELPCGDIWLDEDVIIERKTIGDLLASIADNRLFNQANEMRQLTEWCYIIIEGSLIWYDKKIIGTDWHFRSVQGALLQVQELGVCIVYCNDADDFPKTVEWIGNKDRSKITTIEPRKYGLPITIGEKILSAIPGIGLDRAGKLLREFDSTMAVLECLTDDSCDLPSGIGKKTRQATKEAFGLLADEKIRRTKNGCEK